MEDSALLPAWLWPRAAYLHIPFCAHRCGYCDFAVAAGQDHLIELYVEAINQELSSLGEPQAVETIFVGGGTPTYLPPAVLARFLTSVNQWLPRRSKDGEFSIEANPESITSDMVSVLADHGVNRVSLGVQSFNRQLLGRLDRIHLADEIGACIDRIRRRIDNISLDLIFGIPGQSLDQWDADLTRAIQFSPDHISTYGLTYEKGTSLWKQRERGKIRSISESEELTMYLHAIGRLYDAGIEQYEISNFARQDRRCRHNETYWANEAYFGFGVGAARYINGRRELNCRNTQDYIKRVLAGESPTFQSESLAPEDSARETIAVQLRRSNGVSFSRFHEQTGFDAKELVGNRLDHYATERLIEADEVGFRLTRGGRCVADSLVVKLAWGTDFQANH